MTKNRPAQVFPPGDFLSDELEARGWTQSDFADIIGRPVALVSRIINGKSAISPGTASSFGEALGTTAEFWLNLEATYRLSQVAQPHNAIARRAKLYSEAPVKDLIKRRWIEPASDIGVLEDRVSRFMSLAGQLPYAARKSTQYGDTTRPQRAWLSRAVQIAGGVSVRRAFMAVDLPSLIDQLRTLLVNAEDVREVPRLMAEYGIRLVIIEPLAGSRIDGATFWLDPTSPVVVLSLRYDRIDYFWYTLLHELAHVTNHDGAQLDSDLGDSPEAGKPEAEVKADELASATVVPPNELDDFISRTRPMYSTARIEGFAKRIRVHPGIVIGQLHHRGEIGYRILRQRLVPIRQIVTRSALTDGWGVELPPLIEQ